MAMGCRYRVQPGPTLVLVSSLAGLSSAGELASSEALDTAPRGGMSWTFC